MTLTRGELALRLKGRRRVLQARGGASSQQRP
jgi:hypothetical protein